MQIKYRQKKSKINTSSAKTVKSNHNLYCSQVYWAAFYPYPFCLWSASISVSTEDERNTGISAPMRSDLLACNGCKTVLP